MYTLDYIVSKAGLGPNIALRDIFDIFFDNFQLQRIVVIGITTNGVTIDHK